MKKKRAVGPGKLAFKWLRGDAATQCGVLRIENGELTGHPKEIMDILHDKWMPMFRRYAVLPEPCPNAFLGEYEDEIARLTANGRSPTLTPINEEEIKTALTKMKCDTAAG